MYSPLRNNIEGIVKLTDLEWNLLVPHLKIRKLKKNELFVEIGKTYNEMGFVLDIITLRREKKKQLLSILKIIL